MSLNFNKLQTMPKAEDLEAAIKLQSDYLWLKDANKQVSELVSTNDDRRALAAQAALIYENYSGIVDSQLMAQRLYVGTGETVFEAVSKQYEDMVLGQSQAACIKAYNDAPGFSVAPKLSNPYRSYGPYEPIYAQLQADIKTSDAEISHKKYESSIVFTSGVTDKKFVINREGTTYDGKDLRSLLLSKDADPKTVRDVERMVMSATLYNNVVAEKTTPNIKNLQQQVDAQYDKSADIINAVRKKGDNLLKRQAEEIYNLNPGSI